MDVDTAHQAPDQAGGKAHVAGLDGPTLRAVRESMGVPLRRIARQAGMSHGHLSKVERGEHGRPVTPAITAAYERVTGVKLADAAVGVAERRDRDTGRRGKSWRPGQLTDMRRQAFNAAIGAITIGGHLGEPLSRLIDSTGRPVTPAPPEDGDVAQLEQAVGLLTVLDLRYGGGLVSQLAKAVLRWAVAMLDAADMTDQVAARMSAAVGGLAARAGWAAFDVAAHESARSLFRLALYTAARSADPDLRAHVLADVAAQHNQLGYHQDALAVIRLGEGDERVTPAVRMVLHGVKARAYAAVDLAPACRQHVESAERAHGQAAAATGEVPEWVARLADPAHLYATTGHAMAALAQRTGEPADLRDAVQRLSRAVSAFDPLGHARARALCLARLATLQLATGEVDQATHWARHALVESAGIRSARVAHAVAAIRATATAHHPDHPAVQELVADLDAAAGQPQVE
jgi:transcriptional regulator with XRE-family HTH domain